MIILTILPEFTFLLIFVVAAALCVYVCVCVRACVCVGLFPFNVKTSPK